MSDQKEALSVINRVLPNLNTFIKVVLKREKLSEEAEASRARYELILKTMEEGHTPPRPVSLIGDDDSGYHSTKPKGGYLPDQIPSVLMTGFLLKRDDKYRWHRYWCKVDGKDMKFFIFSDSNEETLIKRLPLATVTSLFGPPQTPECDKENCFILSGIQDGGTEGENGGSEEIYLAAYSDADYQHWHATLSLLTGTRESVRMSSASLLEGTQWGVPAAVNDSISTSSSNFSSNRESMISTTSSLPYILRPPSHDSPPRGRSPLEQGVSAGDTGTLQCKQLQPLPSPPPEDGDDDDTASVGTIYENIDNLVMQFDSTMQATVQAMGQVGQQLKSSKKHKKKDRSLLRQASFLKGGKGHKSKLSIKQKSELEKGECHSGYLYKRSSTGSWKKKWCVLRGAVLSYSKHAEDTEGREYVVLDAKMERISDPKRRFAFTVQLRGVPEPLCFGTDDEQVLNEWISKLENASVTKSDFDWDQWRVPSSDDHPSQYNSNTSLDSMEMSEGHYNVPRTLTSERVSATSSTLHADDAINSGIYSIPRSLPVLDASTFSVHGQPFALSADPFAQYDVPRPISIMPDEEAIYDYPENIVDMEIYDYPPDALSVLPPPPDMCYDPLASNRNSVITLTPDFNPSARSSLAVPDDWNHVTFPPPISLSSSRPSVAISTPSSDEYYQSARNSVASLEGLYDRPRSHTMETLVPSIGEVAKEPTLTKSTDSPETSLEFGVCAMKGYLYKKERFTWNKMNCLIRNSFLECHKLSSTQGPSLKLFLPRSIVTPDKEVKRQWAFKVKHPRREGVLQFAAENEEDYKKWMKAFNSAAEIEVQSVNTVEEIRITDIDMQNRWTTLERNASMLQPPDPTEVKRGMSYGRRNTYSGGEEYMSDTLKRRKKFSWIKSLARKRGMHHVGVSVGQLESDPHYSFTNGKQKSEEQWRAKPPTYIIPPEDRAHHVTTEEGLQQFQGYLRVQRKGADNTWVRYWCVLEDLVISCYISRSDLTLTLSIQLKGSRVADALHDCRQEFSFKIWHLESGQCLFFAADDGIEYGSWFKEVTKGAEYIVPLDAGISNTPMSSPFYHYAKDAPESCHSQRSSRSSITSLPDIDMDNVPTNVSGGVVVHKGNLKKFSLNKWKDRHCLIRDSMLQIFATSTEKTLLASVPLCGSRVELVNVPNEDVHQFTFRVSASTGKVHMFSASSEQEMYTWAVTLQDVSSQASEQREDPSKMGRKNQKANEVELIVTSIPANTLSNAVYNGYTEVLLMDSWSRYWCVIHSGCLYLYQSQDSHATTHIITLKGCCIAVGGPPGCRKPCVITVKCPGVCTVFMAVLDQIQLTLWYNALEQGTKTECLSKRINEKQRAKKDQGIVTVGELPQAKVKPEKRSDTSLPEIPDYDPTKLTDVPPPSIRKYEKKIRKTHRVANMTEQNLKRQLTSLMHFKQELSHLTVKLEELANKGDENAVKRLKNVRVKLQQIDKILPYIGKYIMVNRQAEIQTVAILKESCTVDMQKLNIGTSSPPTANPKPHEQSSSTGIGLIPDVSATPTLSTHFEEEPQCISVEPPTPPVICSESPSTLVQLSMKPKETTAVTQYQQPELPCLHTSTPFVEETPKSITEIQPVSTQQYESPYTNLSLTQAEAKDALNKRLEQKESPSEKVESPYATLVSVRPSVMDDKSTTVEHAEVDKTVSPSSSCNYAELDFTKMQRPAPTSPSSRLNYIQVEFDPNKSKMSLTESHLKEGHVQSNMKNKLASDDDSILDKTLTPENAPPSEAPTSVSPKSRVLAMQDAVRLFEPSQSSTPVKPSNTKPGPPPVKRKSKQQTSSSHFSSIATESIESTSDIETQSEAASPCHNTLGEHSAEAASPCHNTLGEHSADARTVTAGTVSVMERIKALQKQNTS